MDSPNHIPLEKFVSILNEAPWYTRAIRSALSFLAKRIGRGYGLVPLAWPDWALKSADMETYMAKVAKSASFNAGMHSGNAQTLLRISAEIRELQTKT